jgi:glycine/D-amino acid oxidase-like deaminating enzyme
MQAAPATAARLADLVCGTDAARLAALAPDRFPDPKEEIA